VHAAPLEAPDVVRVGRQAVAAAFAASQAAMSAGSWKSSRASAEASLSGRIGRSTSIQAEAAQRRCRDTSYPGQCPSDETAIKPSTRAWAINRRSKGS
jgi:hypothetical protein